MKDRAHARVPATDRGYVLFGSMPKLLPLVLVWLIPAHATARNCFDPVELSSTPFFGEAGTFFADMNRDGRTDVVIATLDAVFPGETSFAFLVRFGRPEPQHFESTIRVMGTYATPPAAGHVFIADVDNDQFPDVVLVRSDKIYVRRNLGGVLDVETPWTTEPFHGDRFFVADIDNDGKADAISTTFSAVHIRRSTGSSFGPEEALKNGAGNHIRYMVDVSGDGRADAIGADATGLYVARFIANDFEPFTVWGAPVPDPDKLHFADVTGDGRRDAISVEASRITVQRNTSGVMFDSPTVWLSGQVSGSITTAFADVLDRHFWRTADLIMVNHGKILGRASDARQFVVGPCF